MAERRHEQVDPHPLAADRHPRLAEVDLQLPSRRRLEAQRRPRLGRELAPIGLHRPLHGAQADLDPPLALEILAHDIRVAPVSVEPLTQPLLQPIELVATPRTGKRLPAARRDVAPHRRAAASELLRQPPRPPAQTMQPHHRRHFVRLQHDLPPRLPYPQRPCHRIIFHTRLLSLQRGQFSLSSGDQFCLSRDSCAPQEMQDRHLPIPRSAGKEAPKAGEASVVRLRLRMRDLGALSV